MKSAAQVIAALFLGICLSLFSNRFIVGTLREGFNWPAALAIAGTLLAVAVGYIYKRPMGFWASVFMISLMAVLLITLGYMEP